MQRKIIIVAGVILVLILSALAFGRFIPEKQEDMLIYDRDGTKETVIDLAIQESDRVLYIRKIKLIMDNPTLGDMIRAINSNGEGVNIQLNDSGEITQIEDYPNNGTEHWHVLIDNKNEVERNVWNIPMENYQGITFIWE